MNRDILIELFRKELNRNNVRWNKQYINKSDDQIIELFGKMYVRRVVSELESERMQKKESGEYTPSKHDTDIAETNTTLQKNAGGGKRNIRGTNSF